MTPSRKSATLLFSIAEQLLLHKHFEIVTSNGQNNEITELKIELTDASRQHSHFISTTTGVPDENVVSLGRVYIFKSANF